MENKDKRVENKSPAIQAILEHLAEEAILLDGVDLWPAIRVDLAASKTLLRDKELLMKKRIIFSACTAVLVLAFVAVFMAKNVTPVSAQTILDKAYAAQSSTAPAQGIEHIRSESYFNLQALAEDQGTDTIVESYSDIQTGQTRLVTSDARSNKILDASSYDGANTYSQDYNQKSADASAPLIIYRTPQGKLADLKPGGSGTGNARDMFDQMRKDPNVQLVGQETWADGRTVYVLQSQQQMKVMVKNSLERPMGLVKVYFDASTYKFVGFRQTMEKDGKELLLGSQKILVDEILPAGSSVAWNLSDLQGVTIVDDPTREHGDLLPEVITPQDLAAKTRFGYLLKTIPDGYSLEISAPPKQSASDPYIYIASYRTPANDYFVIQVDPGAQSDGNETYTTASGLVLTFMKDYSDPSGKVYTSAVVKAPDNVIFSINSTLPRETVKAWAEELVLVK